MSNLGDYEGPARTAAILGTGILEKEASDSELVVLSAQVALRNLTKLTRVAPKPKPEFGNYSLWSGSQDT